MLLELVRNSVLQCFCHSCRAPLLPAAHRRPPLKKPTGKPRTKQPKKRVNFMTTEIKCMEMSKGGLAFEVTLAEPVAGAPAPPRREGSPDKTPSVEEIEGKLRAAEERRRTLEANKMATIAQKMARIEEASRKRDELTNSFIASTKEALDARMETHIGKREQYMSELRTKVKDHLEGVEKTRLSLEQQTSEVTRLLEEKLSSAAAQRDENLKKMVERLKEHEEQVKRVRAGNTERFASLDSSIQEKLQQASARRLQLEREQLDKLRNHNCVKVAEVRNSVEAKVSEMSRELETKLSAAELNRHHEMQKKLEPVKKQERRAEIVRQNKTARAEVPAPVSG